MSKSGGVNARRLAKVFNQIVKWVFTRLMIVSFAVLEFKFHIVTISAIVKRLFNRSFSSKTSWVTRTKVKFKKRFISLKLPSVISDALRVKDRD